MPENDKPKLQKGIEGNIEAVKRNGVKSLQADPNIRSDCYELCVGAVNKKLGRGS